jgi:hypothetical protein
MSTSFHSLTWKNIDITIFRYPSDVLDKTIQEEQQCGWEVYNIQTIYYDKTTSESLVRVIFNRSSTIYI